MNKNNVAYKLTIIVQVMAIPLLILTPFFSGSWPKGQPYSSASLLVAIVLLAITAYVSWSKQLFRLRGALVIAHTLGALLIAVPTMWAYGALHAAAVQHISTCYQTNACMNIGLMDGVSPSTAGFILILLFLIPGVNMYRYYINPKRLYGVPKDLLFK